MELSHLKPDELDYEFNLRNIDPYESGSFTTLQSILNAELNGGRELHQDDTRITRTTVTRELKECDAKLVEIIRDLDDAFRKVDDELSAQGQTRLQHIGLRVGRLQSFAPDHAGVNRLAERIKSLDKETQVTRDSLGSGKLGAGAPPLQSSDSNNIQRRDSTNTGTRPKDKQQTSTQQLQPVMDRWQPSKVPQDFTRTSVNKNLGSLSSLFESVRKDPPHLPAVNIARNSMDGPAVRENIPQIPSPRSFQRQPNPDGQDIQQPLYLQNANFAMAGGHRIHQWPFRFDGVAKGLDAEDFLFRVERQAQLNGVSTQALVLGIGNLLTGRASQWYWTYQRQFQDASWNQLKHAFLGRYAPHQDTDFEIISKMEKRRQQPGETFNNFCQDIEALAVRLRRRLLAEDLIEILRRNMSVHLRKALWRQEIATVDELLYACNEYENLCIEEQQLANPGRRLHVHELSNNQLTYATNGQYTQRELYEQPDEYNVSAIGTSANQEHQVCWNCKERGHPFGQCKQPRKIFCFTCGLDGVNRMECPRCTENIRRGVMPAAPTRPQHPAQPQIMQRPLFQNPFQSQSRQHPNSQ